MRPSALILGVAAVACGALWFSLPGRAPQAAVPVVPGALRARSEPAPPPALLEACEAPAAREANSPSAPAAPAPRADPAAAVRTLCSLQAGPQWVDGARASAAVLDADALSALARSAASPATPALERCAAAELLRHAPGAVLPAEVLAFLRERFEARESEPLLALAAVRALAAFGGADDRARLLDAAAQSSSLALAGLSCARGDEAARELAALAGETRDARRAEVALAALASIAASDEGGLTPRARAECAAVLGSPFGDAREARRLCALAALEPVRSTGR